MATILKECSVHGITEYYSYNGVANKCVICAKKKATEWKKDNPKILDYQKNYMKQWCKYNKEKILQYREKHLENLRTKKEEREEDFYNKFGKIIKKISKDLELKKISSAIKNIKNPNYESIFNFLLKAKKNEIITYERGRLSSIYKWRVLKSYDMSSANTKQIKEIWKYKKEAIRVTEERIKKILERIK
jgi:hypothetical protein